MIVIKYGGHALPTPETDDPILRVIADFHNAGNHVVLVHGGGPQIDSELAIHVIEGKMIGGYRATTPAIFNVVQKVLSGEVLRTLVNKLISYGVDCVGISSGDGSTIRSIKMKPVIQGIPTDMGLVGDIESTQPKLLMMLVQNGYLPVVSPVSVTSLGEGLNLNADIAAGAIGGALKADAVIFMTDVAGIYRNYPDPTSIITEISAIELKELQPSFAQGMVPKVAAALSALAAGAKSVRIIDGRDGANLSAALKGVGGTVVFP